MCHNKHQLSFSTIAKSSVTHQLLSIVIFYRGSLAKYIPHITHTENTLLANVIVRNSDSLLVIFNTLFEKKNLNKRTRLK